MAECNYKYGIMSGSVVLFSYSEGSLSSPLRVRMHTHSFWQLQWVDGPWELVEAERTISLKRFDLVIIPPHTPHGFNHPGRGEAATAVMFELPDPPPSSTLWVVRKSAFSTAWIQCAHALRVADPSGGSSGPLGELLDALLGVLAGTADEVSRETGLVRRAKAHIEENMNLPPTVGATARALGVSRGYLSAEFKRETGRTLKAHIDNQRLQLARRLLRFGDFSVSRIADTMGFPDVFAFSRFFHARNGTTPTAFRKQPARRIPSSAPPEVCQS